VGVPLHENFGSGCTLQSLCFKEKTQGFPLPSSRRQFSIAYLNNLQDNFNIFGKRKAETNIRLFAHVWLSIYSVVLICKLAVIFQKTKRKQFENRARIPKQHKFLKFI
jgi:hypothetical protein